MATGRSNYLTKQTGEYLVAAELSRTGYIATTFTGNVPYYDIVAVDESGGHTLVQVKAISGSSWQFNADQFAQITFEGQRQLVGRQVPDPYPGLVCVLVQLRLIGSAGADHFFILPWRELCRIVVAGHSRYLRKHGGIRPRKPTSLHTALSPRQIGNWENRWDILKSRLKPTPASTALRTTAARTGQARPRVSASR
jgi:hypothetical protein